MRNRESIITSIISHFAVLKAEVELRSKVNLQDINSLYCLLFLTSHLTI